MASWQLALAGEMWPVGQHVLMPVYTSQSCRGQLIGRLTRIIFYLVVQGGDKLCWGNFGGLHLVLITVSINEAILCQAEVNFDHRVTARVTMNVDDLSISDLSE